MNKTARMLSVVRDAVQESIRSGNAATVSQQLTALLQLEHDRRIEVEMELADLRLRVRYHMRRKDDKWVS